MKNDHRAKQLKLFTIAYSSELYSIAEAGFLVLDNRENKRPDWREYWPIRNFLLYETLEDDCLYGFFSPKFSSKTGLSFEQVSDFIVNDRSCADVFLFTPFPDLGAVCLNVFEQKEFVDKGFTQISQMVLDSIGFKVNLTALVMDSRSTVFSNFIVASKKFWLEWLDVCEKIYSMCESGDGELSASMTGETSYTGNVQRKVFLIERIASLLLSTQNWRAKPYNTWPKAVLTPMLANLQHEAIVSNALKMAYNDLKFEEYVKAFYVIRKIILQK